MIDENPTPTTVIVDEAPGEAAGPVLDHRKRKRGPRMDRLAHVRRGLGHVYRALSAWDPPDLKPAERIARARALGYLLSEVGSALRAEDIEIRLQRLEVSIRARGH
jgi:hypothetical protein